MTQEQSTYAWEKDIYDDDGEPWILTMISLMVLPIYQGMKVTEILSAVVSV